MSFRKYLNSVSCISFQKEYFLNHYEPYEEYYGCGKTKRQRRIDNWHDYERRKWSRIRKMCKRRKKPCRMRQEMNSTQETMFGQCGRESYYERQSSLSSEGTAQQIYMSDILTVNAENM